MFKKFIYTMLFVLLFSVNAIAWEKKDYVTYFGTTDQQIKFAWNTSVGATDKTVYEVKLFNVEKDTEVLIANGKTQDTDITISLPRTGHYILRIRACSDNTADKKCSEWVESINPEFATVDGSPRAWWVYGHIASPGTIIIQ